MSPSIQRRGLLELATLARAGWCTALALVLASACGGQSFQATGGEAGEASSGGATSNAGSGGAASSAGSSSKPHAGSSNRGGSSSAGGSGTAGTSGTAGAPPFTGACIGPSELAAANGSFCAAYFPRWTHDSTTGVCVPVVYGGCGATKNNYETLQACQAACPGGSPNYDACKVATDCVLGATGCCGVCDGPSVSKHDFIAYNKANIDKVEQCVNGDVACGACPNPETPFGARQFFVPNCVAGECVVEDIRESDVTACASAEDCQLRNGSGCCEGCSSSDLVAVRNDGSLERLVCGDEIPPCLACEPTQTVEAIAVCEPTGHCAVSYPLK